MGQLMCGVSIGADALGAGGWGKAKYSVLCCRKLVARSLSTLCCNFDASRNCLRPSADFVLPNWCCLWNAFWCPAVSHEGLVHLLLLGCAGTGKNSHQPNPSNQAWLISTHRLSPARLFEAQGLQAFDAEREMIGPYFDFSVKLRALEGVW